MTKIDHFVISPTLKYLDCALEWLQYEINSITRKIIFRRQKIFGPFAERNDGYDELSEKKLKFSKNSVLLVEFVSGKCFVQFLYRVFSLQSLSRNLTFVVGRSFEVFRKNNHNLVQI